ncbi:DUF4352 domain-containing protein [Cellulomonas iranensis]|uniref:DUF4352 domain-containing protein n=1 Tax=Cellulomonas iranensis TaxID=76862 RepID=UPI001CF35D5D|nr:DUF4352 domain-containing protein [Cellulomonas iranensis]UCN14982.1 DUF4352 domain-containing protein [Cellulomonas iranensis]
MSQPVPDPSPAPQPRRSWFARHKILTTLGAVVVVVAVASALGGRGDDAPPASPAASAPAGDTPPAEESPASTAAGIGTPVRDGKFEFTVTGVEPGVTRVGDDMFGEDAQGQFLLVHVTVTNIGDEAQYFDGSSQKLTDTQGRTHSADTGAAIYLGDAQSFLNQINPGNSVQGTVVFDVPADAAPATVELHDSPFSGGVEVTLG